MINESISGVTTTVSRDRASLPLPLCLLKPHAGAAVIFGDEFDAGTFEGGANGTDRSHSGFGQLAFHPF
jgi:hypothetical protein